MTQLNEQNFQMSSIFTPIKLCLQSANQTDPLPARQESSVALGSSWLKITVDEGSRKGWSQDTVLSEAMGLGTAWHPFPGFVEGHVGRGEEELLHLSFHCLSESTLTLNFLILGHTWPESRFYLLAAGNLISY